MSSYKLLLAVVIFISSVGCNSKANKNNHLTGDTSGYKAPTPGYLPDSIIKKYHDGVQEFYNKRLLKTGFNGAILVAKNGQVVFEDYHGYANLKTKDTLTRHTAFHLASVSKTFTAMAILKLVEMNKLSLDSSVQSFFPGFPYEGVTVKLLLNHRSGLPNYTHYMENMGWNKKQYCSNQDILDFLIKYKPIGTGRPDTHFSYCNTNYSLLALIIEKASGQSYSDFLTANFFKPLQMNDTYVFNMATDSAKALPSYTYKGGLEPFTFLDAGYGDKNIYSTPEDMLKWDQALYPGQLFPQVILDEAFAPYSNEKPGVRNYGLGWRMNVYPDGQKVVYHNGWWHGNNTVFIRMIQDSATIIVLGNKFNNNIYHAKEIGDIFHTGINIQD